MTDETRFHCPNPDCIGVLMPIYQPGSLQLQCYTCGYTSPRSNYIYDSPDSFRAAKHQLIERHKKMWSLT